MIRNPFTFFSKSSPPPINELPIPLDDHIEKVDSSFQLLRDTTTQVTEAAIEATKSIERRFVDTEYRFFSTIDAIDDFVIIKDGDGRWKTLNRSGQIIFGWIHGEYHDKTDLELARMYPIFTESLSLCSESDERAWRSRKTFRSQECIPYGPGGYRCFDILKTPIFDEHGKRKEMIVIGRDITEELEKQRRMKAAFVALNSVSDIILILDYRGNVFFCNDVFLMTFNIASYESLIGKHVCDIINIPEFDDMWEIASQNSKWDGTCTGDGDLYTKDGHDISVTPMMNGQPYPIYYICTLRPKKK